MTRRARIWTFLASLSGLAAGPGCGRFRRRAEMQREEALDRVAFLEQSGESRRV